MNGGTAAQSRNVLNARFAGRRFVVFYRTGDGPDRDITSVISYSQTKRTHSVVPSMIKGRSPHGEGFLKRDIEHFTVPGRVVSAPGAAEVLRIQTGGGSPLGGGYRGKSPRISLWAVGRVSLRVEARSFDQTLGDDVQSAAERMFMASWGLRMQVECASMYVLYQLMLGELPSDVRHYR